MKRQHSAAKKSRSATLNGWVKKEKHPEKNAVRDATILDKDTLKVYLEPLDTKLIEKSNVQSSVKPNKNLSKESAGKENVETKTQSTGLRRSARNLPPDQKAQLEKQKSEVEKSVDDIEDKAVKSKSKLPPIKFKGKIKFINEFNECASACDSLLKDVESSKDVIVPVGFDLEWPFSFRTGSGKTALAQICLSEKECYLLHLFEFKKLPASLIALLTHPKVKLVGVNIKNDVRKLGRDFKEFPDQKVVDNNCLDCGPYANLVFHRSGRWSLERLTAYLLKSKISKDPEVRMSKWHIQPLSPAQLLYAATDAYVSLLLHLTIEQQEALNQAHEEEAAAAMTNQ